MKLQLSKNLSLPVELVTQTIGVVAMKRSGKSYFARRLAEQFHRAGQQVVVVDPKGDWWGILSSSDGKGPGLPFIIIGGERGHVPLEPSGGEVVAKLVVEERVSALLDLSELRKHEVATFMAMFMETLYRLKNRERFRTPMMLLIDEADAIAPQKPEANEARMLGAANDIVRRGGQRGIGCTMITQRTAVLSKNVLTQCQILIALRTIGPQDLAAMNAWIDVHGSPAERKTLMESLPSLPVGDAWVWSPGWPTDVGIFERIHTLPIATFDSGATPKPGERRVEPKQVAEVDLDAVRVQMAATIERARAEDPRALQKRVKELEEALRKSLEAERKALRPPPPSFFEEQEELSHLERALGELQKRIAQVSKNIAKASASQPTAAADAGRIVTGAYGCDGDYRMGPGLPGPRARTRQASAAKAPRDRELPKRAPVPAASSGSDEARVGDGERKILVATAQHVEGATRQQLTVITGYKRSTRDTYLQRLRAKEFIEERDGRIYVAGAGVAWLGDDYEPLPTGRSLLEHWLRALPEGEGKILACVANGYPERVSRDAITEQTGYKRSTRDTYLQRLGLRELVDADRDGVIASKDLF